MSHFWPVLLASFMTVMTPIATHAASDTPTEDFTDNGDGTVTHKKTGLTWMRCAMGQTWNGAFCAGEYKTYTLDEAKALTLNFAGQTDWRLPTLLELDSIVDRSKYNPAINQTIFSKAPGEDFWSSTSSAQSNGYNWKVGFNSGGTSEAYPNYDFGVRLVRGGPVQSNSSFTLSTPTSDFTDNGNGTVTHKLTGLIWKRCVEGQNWGGSSCQGAAKQYAWKEAKALGGTFAGSSEWRLPTAHELLTIVELATTAPAINPLMFPETPSDYFWSSSGNASYSSDGYNWGISFSSGALDGLSGSSYYARLVRNGTTTPTGVDLAVSLTDSPDPVKAGASLTYTATVTNASAKTASNTLLTVYLPKNSVSFVSSSADCQYKQTSVVCTLGDLAANASVNRAIVVQIKKPGGLSVSAQVRSDTADTKPDNNLARSVTAIQP
ncbi:MAG: DUF1566 domain-containing protein [Methylococcaceae bacterium]